MKYSLHPALREDMESGSIWIGAPTFPSRTVVTVRNPATGKRVYCEVKIIDGYFLEYYEKRIGFGLDDSKSAFLASEWYRKELGITSSTGQIDLEVIVADSCWGRIFACLHHPQVVVRIATILGIVSVGLGLLGVLLAIVPFIPKCPT